MTLWKSLVHVGSAVRHLFCASAVILLVGTLVALQSALGDELAKTSSEPKTGKTYLLACPDGADVFKFAAEGNSLAGAAPHPR